MFNNGVHHSKVLTLRLYYGKMNSLQTKEGI